MFFSDITSISLVLAWTKQQQQEEISVYLDPADATYMIDADSELAHYVSQLFKTPMYR